MSRQPVSRRRHGPEGIAAITLFVEDLAEAKRFYDEVKRRGAERLNGPVARP